MNQDKLHRTYIKANKRKEFAELKKDFRKNRSTESLSEYMVEATLEKWKNE